MALRASRRRLASNSVTALLDEAFKTLHALQLAADRAGLPAEAEARRVIEGTGLHLQWIGRWLDQSYTPRAPDPARGSRALREIATCLDELIEELEGDDAVGNADLVQTSSLAFAALGALADWLQRTGLDELSGGPGRR